MPQLPSFPAPDIEGVIDAVREVLADLTDEATGPIENISQSLIDIWEMDCGGKWFVWLKTGTIAASKALYMLLVPSLDEIFENYLQPKPGRRGGRRGQKGDRIRKAVSANAYRLILSPPIPDIDNEIADILPGRGFLKGRRMAPGEWAFWTAVDVADSILWQWLLIEATETFTVTWTSELMQSGECKYETDAGTKFTTIEQTPFFNNELWFDKDTNLYTYENNINVFNNGGVALQGPHHEGHMLCIVLGHWRVKRDNSPGVGIWNVGIHGEARDRWGDIVADVTEFTQLTAGPGEIATATLDFGIISEEVHSVNLFYETETVQAANTEYFWCNADVNIGVRSIVDA